MRLMLVTTSLIVGGAENQVYLLAKEFRRHGHFVAVVSLREPEAYTEELQAMGIDVRSLHMQHNISDIAAVARLARLVREWRPDVLHAHMFHAILLARLVRIGVHVPVLVSTTHNFSPESGVRRALYRLTDGLGTITTNVSGAGAAAYALAKAAPPSRIQAFPNGILIPETPNDVALRTRKRAELDLGDEFTWIAVGRLEAPKDYPNLLRGIQALVNLGSESRFLIVGDGSESESIKQLFANLVMLHDRVQFLGTRTDVNELMMASDAYVMSSSSEGLPLVLLEACSTCLPIVATDVGGNTEIVSHGNNGYIVPARDPESLAKSMRRLETLSVEDRKVMGLNGRKHVEESFEIGAVADRWLKLFESWLGVARS